MYNAIKICKHKSKIIYKIQYIQLKNKIEKQRNKIKNKKERQIDRQIYRFIGFCLNIFKNKLNNQKYQTVKSNQLKVGSLQLYIYIIFCISKQQHITNKKLAKKSKSKKQIGKLQIIFTIQIRKKQAFQKQMSSFLNAQTPIAVKNRFSKNLLSATSYQTNLQSTAASQKWNNQSFTSTPQVGRNLNDSSIFDSHVQKDLFSNGINASQLKKTLVNSSNNNPQRYFADNRFHDNVQIQNSFGFDNQQINNRGNQLTSHSLYPNAYQNQGADDQYRTINTILKVNNNYQYGTTAANNQQYPRQQENFNLQGQSISQQMNAQYLASKSLQNPANNILNLGISSSAQINQQNQTNENKVLKHIKNQELHQNQRLISTMREQGFLQSQQNDVLLNEGQTFILSQKNVINILIALITLVIVYVIYRINCLVLNTQFSALSQLKYIGALLLSVASKSFMFKHKAQINSNFIIFTIIGFCIDTLAIQYCINEVINVYFYQKLHMEIKYNFKEYYLMALSTICSLFFYINGNYIERNQIQNVNKQIRTIVCQVFSDTFNNIMDLIQICLLPIFIAYLGIFLNGEKVASLFSSKYENQMGVTKSLVLIYILTLSQTFLFKICSELIINLNSQYIWNFLSEIHETHQIQHFYFIFADQKLNDDYLELKALKFWQSNYNNKQRVNILRNISIEGQKIQIWNVFLRYSQSLKERFSNFKINNFGIFENRLQVVQNTPKQFIYKFGYLLRNFQVLYAYLSAYSELLFLLDMVTYSIQNLTNTVLVYNNISEYQEMFQQSYSLEIISDFMSAVFQDLIELQGVIEKDKKLALAQKQLLSSISTLNEISKDKKLFGVTINRILKNSESFYQSDN
ncbi:transmembrane protein, putative (macronuclear) [Tetrahymena thermophila SB210]|uniref:Transmembrane protein, putative n=1 Tax=Tetrahymena thermophila (strain SB210) TaxID=312017 RepID=Q24FW0_TETTS|nr:transmembrane protein, putative [Tetrahymena thermophila SB210]EAS06650.3 transmembrane protein, putative [Tetrahymena thermophila SB210]|eukprot:XP_001026895.3 transmembrane protein, putative [Tetrahymena thermophila SB210]